MNAMVYVNMDQSIHKGKSKNEWYEKWRKKLLCGISFYIKYSKFLRILLFFSEEYLKNYLVLFNYHNKILIMIYFTLVIVGRYFYCSYCKIRYVSYQNTYLVYCCTIWLIYAICQSLYYIFIGVIKSLLIIYSYKVSFKPKGWTPIF